MSQPQFRVPKRERSPTPPVGSLSRQVTSGSKRISPVPASCARGVPGFSEARKAWAREEGRKLTALGLIVTKVFLRDDGLVLDWESPVPVWADTLLPVSLAQQEPHAKVGNVNNDTQMEDSSTQQQSEALQALDNEPNELEDMAIQYLRRYVRTFDADRTALMDAYAAEAMFSYCIHDIVSPNSLAAAFTNSGELQRFAPRKGSRNLLKATSDKNISVGKSEVITTLKSLGPHKFCAFLPATFDYDVLNLPGTPLVLLVCKGDVVDERQGRQHRLSVHQSFVLRKNPDSDAIRSTDKEKWPLVALSHQMSVRDLSLMPATH